MKKLFYPILLIAVVSLGCESWMPSASHSIPPKTFSSAGELKDWATIATPFVALLVIMIGSTVQWLISQRQQKTQLRVAEQQQETQNAIADKQIQAQFDSSIRQQQAQMELSAKQQRAQLLEKWNNQFQDMLADYIGNIEALIMEVRAYNEKKSKGMPIENPIAKQAFENLGENMRKSYVLQYKLGLMINPNQDEANSLFQLILSLQKAFDGALTAEEKTQIFNARREHIVLEARRLVQANREQIESFK